MSLDARGGVQTVDVDAARIVDEIGLGGADEMAQLIVAAPGQPRLLGISGPRGQLTRWGSWWDSSTSKAVQTCPCLDSWSSQFAAHLREEAGGQRTGSHRRPWLAVRWAVAAAYLTGRRGRGRGRSETGAAVFYSTSQLEVEEWAATAHNNGEGRSGAEGSQLYGQQFYRICSNMGCIEGWTSAVQVSCLVHFRCAEDIKWDAPAEGSHDSRAKL